jgi:amino acid transporter
MPLRVPHACGSAIHLLLTHRGGNKVKTPAVVLIVIGLAIVIWGAFGFTTREKVVDIGPIHATKETHHDVPYGTIAGGVIVLGGVLLLAKSKS